MNKLHCSRPIGLVLVGLILFFASPLQAQQAAITVKVKKVEMGFPRYDDVSDGAFKSGLWTPVYVTFAQDEKGNIVLPLDIQGISKNTITLGVNDGEGMPGTYEVDVELGQSPETTAILYANPGTQSPNMNLHLLPGKNQEGRKHQLPARNPGDRPLTALPLGSHLYLTVGTKMPKFKEAIEKMPGLANDQGDKARVAAYETDPGRLPDLWFGYQAVDLLILTTDNKQFVKDFFTPATAKGEKRLLALIEWVRQGGQLVLSVSTQNQDKVHSFLKSNLWQPPFPNVLSANKTEDLTSMARVHQWANIHDHTFPASTMNPVKVAVLQPDKSMDVLISGLKGDAVFPVMVRVPYGRGSVTMLAFELDRNPFAAWEGAPKFFQRLVAELGPKVRAHDEKDGNPNMGGAGMVERGMGQNDVTSRLHRELDQFNVPMISFGWVALFIVLYILIVGPLDYLILKKVFKRLEWTWITFPAIVILISVVAYFAAYALKGNQMKVNKVDLVDIDMRTYLDEEYKPKKAYASGNTWFGILSPQIKNYTIGIKPVLGNWVGDPGVNPQVGETMITWMGRPEDSGPGGFGRSRSASLFRRAYNYAADATGLVDMPIPVWTTRAFTATWEAKFDALPFTVDLTYPANKADQPMSGTIQNNLTVDLEDVYLIYGQKFYHLDRPLPALTKDLKGEPVPIKEGSLTATDLSRWVGKDEQPAQNFGGKYGFGATGPFAPTALIKQLLFFDKVQAPDSFSRNHLLRPLDQSWRITTLAQNDTSVRTAILIGRLARAEGALEELTEANDPHLPTQLWLGTLPSGSATRQPLSGTIIQDTYIRVFVPVRPKE